MSDTKLTAKATMNPFLALYPVSVNTPHIRKLVHPETYTSLRPSHSPPFLIPSPDPVPPLNTLDIYRIPSITCLPAPPTLPSHFSNGSSSSLLTVLYTSTLAFSSLSPPEWSFCKYKSCHVPA